MIEPKKPDNEFERLKYLRSLMILDTPPEPVFDSLAQIAAKIANCPAALVSLVDDERQWFKSTFGLEATETPRNISFCAHAIEKGQELYIENATKEPLTEKNPMVTDEPGIRFYFGTPLIGKKDLALGTVCVFDFKAGSLSDQQKELLRELGQVATFLIENYRAKHEIKQSALEFDQLHQQFSENSATLQQQLSLIKLGELAGTISHEIHNALSHIATLCEVEKLKLPEDSPFLKTLEKFQNITDDIADRTLAVTSAARSAKSVDADTFDLTDLIQAAQTVCKPKLKRYYVNINTMTEVETKAFANPAEVFQVIVNLLDNAIDATSSLPEEDRNIIVDFEHLTGTDKDQNKLRTTFTNFTGPIPKETSEQMFDLYFSTKPFGEGSGIGLAICKKLIEKNNGQISFATETGRTAFSFDLPMVNGN